MHRRISSLLNHRSDNNRNRSRDSLTSSVTSPPPSYVAHTARSVPDNEIHSYATNIPSSPPNYVPEISDDRHDERVSESRSGVSSAPSVSDSSTLPGLPDGSEPSLADTDTLPRSEGRGTLPVDLQYLYYRVYTEDGAIRSLQSLSTSDLSLSRIYARSVAPPHTVASLKRCLCKVENIEGNTNLYATLSSRTAIDDRERISLHPDTRPGRTAQEPMAFVVHCLDPERTTLPTANTVNSSRADTQFPETRYVYYRVYTADGDIPSKQPVNPNDPSLGCIRVDSIPPPRTAASMRRTISRVEKFLHPWHAKLFLNMFSESPMDDTHDPNDFLFSLDQPLAFVLPILLKSRVSANYSSGDRSFLKMALGETYFTDGILLKRRYKGTEYDVYQVVRPTGGVGFVFPGNVDKISYHTEF